MDFSLQDLRLKDIINLSDGRRLGRCCDVVVSYPEGKFLGIVAPDRCGRLFRRADLFIEVKQIKKIGEDVILVELNPCPKPNAKGKCLTFCVEKTDDRRSYEEYE